MSPQEVVAAYKSKGYQAIGFTDHYDPDLTPEKTRQTREELEERDTSMDVFVGSEACVFLPGWPSRRLRKFRSRHLDFCIMSPSHYPRSSQSHVYDGLPIDVQASRVMDSFIEAVRTEYADAVAHPFAYGIGQIPRRDRVLSKIGDDDLRWALALARENGIAMEFSPRVLGLGDRFLTRFVNLCNDVGVQFSLGGDAHAPQSIGNDRLLIPLLRRFGIGEDRIWFPARL
jgi:histidinol phosphatase-like PHP family hydrolase